MRMNNKRIDFRMNECEGTTLKLKTCYRCLSINILGISVYICVSSTECSLYSNSKNKLHACCYCWFIFSSYQTKKRNQLYGNECSKSNCESTICTTETKRLETTSFHLNGMSILSYIIQSLFRT